MDFKLDCVSAHSYARLDISHGLAAPSRWTRPYFARHRRQFCGSAARQHGCLHHLAVSQTPRPVALLCGDGHSWGANWRLHHFRSGKKRWQAGVGKKISRAEGREALSAFRALVHLDSYRTSTALTSVSAGAVPDRCWSLDVFAERVPGLMF